MIDKLNTTKYVNIIYYIYKSINNINYAKIFY